MTVEAPAAKQRAGILTLQLLGTPGKYKAELLDTEWLLSPALHMQAKRAHPEVREFSDDPSIEAYLRPLMPFILEEGEAMDLMGKIKAERSVTKYICCTKLDWIEYLRKT